MYIVVAFFLQREILSANTSFQLSYRSYLKWAEDKLLSYCLETVTFSQVVVYGGLNAMHVYTIGPVLIARI